MTFFKRKLLWQKKKKIKPQTQQNWTSLIQLPLTKEDALKMQNLSLGESQNIGMTHPGCVCKFFLGNHKREMKTAWSPEARDTFRYVQGQAGAFPDRSSYTF